MTKHWVIMVIAAAMGGVVTGCDGKPADHAPSGAEPGQDGKAKDLSHPAKVASGEAKAPSTTPPPAPPEEENLTQDTSDGAMKLFLKAVKSGDFRRIAELTDPASEAYESLSTMGEQLDPATANPNVPKEQLEFVRSMFSMPWKNTRAEKVSEGEGRAKFLVTFGVPDEKDPNSTPTTRTIDLNLFQGVWRILATNDLLRPPAPQKLPTNPPTPRPDPS